MFPKRKVIAATDSTGYSGRKEHWNQVDYNVRANQDWVKAHTVFETSSLIILNYELTKSNVHDSKPFKSLWNKLPVNVTPKRSVADTAYTTKDIMDFFFSLFS